MRYKTIRHVDFIGNPFAMLNIYITSSTNLWYYKLSRLLDVILWLMSFISAVFNSFSFRCLIINMCLIFLQIKEKKIQTVFKFEIVLPDVPIICARNLLVDKKTTSIFIESSVGGKNNFLFFINR